MEYVFLMGNLKEDPKIVETEGKKTIYLEVETDVEDTSEHCLHFHKVVSDIEPIMNVAKSLKKGDPIAVWGTIVYKTVTYYGAFFTDAYISAVDISEVLSRQSYLDITSTRPHPESFFQH